jgi:putative redox protein
MTRETKSVTIAWTDGMRFEGGAPGGPAIVVDGNGIAGPSPVNTLLIAVAGCTGSDVISILQKMRLKVTAFRVEISGVRREEEPRRFLSLHLTYHVAGEGIEEGKVRRAVDLSLEKYCSVTHSLAPDIAITYDVALA